MCWEGTPASLVTENEHQMHVPLYIQLYMGDAELNLGRRLCKQEPSLLSHLPSPLITSFAYIFTWFLFFNPIHLSTSLQTVTLHPK